MLVIPDTNALFSDPFLEKPLTTAIMAAEERADIRLVVPEVVVDELRGQVEREMKELGNNERNLRRKLARLSGQTHSHNSHITPEQNQSVMNRFEKKIEQLVKEDRILSYPSISLKELADRSIRDRPPFQPSNDGKRKSDRGMRDTIIWMTIKECLERTDDTTPQILFVSADTAFAKGGNILQESILEEIESEGLSRDMVAVRSSLGKVVDFISDRLPKEEFIKVAVESGQIKDFTDQDDAVAILAQEWIYEHGPVLYNHNEFMEYFDYEFDVLEGTHFDYVEYTLDLGNNQVLVNSEWTGQAGVTESLEIYQEKSLTASLRFKVSSIVEGEDERLSAKSHEIAGMEVQELEDSSLFHFVE